MLSLNFAQGTVTVSEHAWVLFLPISQPSTTGVSQATVEVRHHFQSKWNGFEPYPTSDESPTLLIVVLEIPVRKRRERVKGWCVLFLQGVSASSELLVNLLCSSQELCLYCTTSPLRQYFLLDFSPKIPH